MKEYSVSKDNAPFFRWEGRILKKQGIGYLGYTNSSISIRVKGNALSAYFVTGDNEEVNRPGLRIYMDGSPVSEIVLDKREGWYPLCETDTSEIHEVRIIKITEAAMSYAGLRSIGVDCGELVSWKDEPDNRTRVEFIGDSITCGYGVHGEPESEYTIREEDGECSYAAFMAEKMNWNARWISASGYGMYMAYSGNTDENVPKLYPYVNWFIDKEKRIDAKEFEPRFIFVNLGTNDSGHLYREDARKGFLTAYEKFLRLLRGYHKDSTIICVLGTLCKGVFPYVEQVVEQIKDDGICAVELPYHDVEQDGMASMHPSIVTQRKDAERLIKFMEQKGLL